MENEKLYKFSLIADLSERLNSVSPQFGKTVLQKMIFILQEVYDIPCGYKFSLYSYGPYCSDIPKDLDFVTAISGTEVCRVNNGYGGYTISPGDKCKEIKAFGRDFLERYKSKIKKAVDDFGSYNARDLELRSTIIYCCKEMGGIHSGSGSADEIIKIVHELKPKFQQDEIESVTLGLVEQKICHLTIPARTGLRSI